MAETRAGSEKISVVLEIQEDAETRERMRDRLLEVIQEIRENSTAHGTCTIWTAKGIQSLEIGSGT